MAQTTVNVVFQELATASKNLSNISSEMKAITERMSKLIENISEVWKDDNGRAFVSRFETEVQSKFKLYYDDVAAYSNFIKGAYDTYLNHESTTKASIQRTA